MGARDRIPEISRRLLERAEKVALAEPDNGTAMVSVISALAGLGEFERAREWIERALLLDPDNLNMKYNIVCALVIDFHDHDAALELLEPMTKVLFDDSLRWLKVDADLDPIRDDPRFVAMIDAWEKRLGSLSPEGKARPAPSTS
jgi:adenylate cyclase